MSVIYTNAAERAAMRMKINVGRTSQVSNLEEERKALHEDIEIKCFYEGSTTLLIGSEIVTANAGDVVVINPYEFHATVACDAEKSHYHLFMISLDYFAGSGMEEAELRNLFLAGQNAFQTLFVQNRRLWQLLMDIAEEFTMKKSAYPVAIRGLTTQLFALLLRDGMVQPKERHVKNEMLYTYQLIEPALRHIRDHYSEEMAIEDLALLCQISKYYFCRVFKAVIGNSAMGYLREYRLKVADTMLGNTDKSISFIAERCGFSDTNYFCRRYKQRYGITPNKRRNAVRSV